MQTKGKKIFIFGSKAIIMKKKTTFIFGGTPWNNSNPKPNFIFKLKTKVRSLK